MTAQTHHKKESITQEQYEDWKARMIDLTALLNEVLDLIKHVKIVVESNDNAVLQ